MALGNTQMILAERRNLREGDVEISERAFNLLIGGVLLWGFGLNYLTVALFGEQVARLFYGMNPIVILVGYFALVLAGSALIRRPSPALSFLGYNLIAVPVGLVLCISLQGYYVETIRTTALVTAVITLSFMIAATIYPDFFLKLGRVLFFSLVILIVGEVVSLLFFRGTGMAYAWLGAGVFSMYIGYDWARANTCARTVDNAIDLSASLYLDIINLFLRVLRIMGRRRN